MRFGELIREFTDDSYGRLVDLLNTGMTKLTLGENLSGEVVEVVLPADGTEVEIPHSLKTVPKYRIIVGQSGCGIIVDGVKEWTERYIYLKLCTLSVTVSSQNVTYRDDYDISQFNNRNLTIPANSGNLTNDEVTAKVLIMRG